MRLNRDSAFDRPYRFDKLIVSWETQPNRIGLLQIKPLSRGDSRLLPSEPRFFARHRQFLLHTNISPFEFLVRIVNFNCKPSANFRTQHSCDYCRLRCKIGLNWMFLESIFWWFVLVFRFNLDVRAHPLIKNIICNRTFTVVFYTACWFVLLIV